ncbi:hypothetical protein GWK47_049799 [Chionoecetes opilio]|uniref:Core-binding (CB) domain-containing protein n=1 Tax=Chionoecetes opilio TaxID=41210 RepID=A0A8J5CT67_CHIOP|nr:hypothetical protein GWK47_049799 [Chionoecetes opilio]
MVAPLWPAQPWFSELKAWCPPLFLYWPSFSPGQASFHLEATRLEFLRTSLRRTVSDTVAEDMLAALRPSSTRQYQSHWKAFQSFLKLKGLRDVSESVVLDFLSCSAHDRGRSSATLSTHLAALADPSNTAGLRALTRFPSGRPSAGDGSAVSLSLSPKVLGKKRAGGPTVSKPVVVPAWTAGDAAHPLCPVSALRCYLDASEPWACDLQFCSATLSLVVPSPPGDLPAGSGASSSRRIRVTPRSHDVRGVAASLAFLRTHSLEKVREGGQWSTASCFVARYLSYSVVDSPCVALGLPPSGGAGVVDAGPPLDVSA